MHKFYAAPFSQKRLQIAASSWFSQPKPTQITTTNTTTNALPEAHEEWERELLRSMYAFANDEWQQIESVRRGGGHALRMPSTSTHRFDLLPFVSILLDMPSTSPVISSAISLPQPRRSANSHQQNSNGLISSKQ